MSAYHNSTTLKYELLFEIEAMAEKQAAKLIEIINDQPFDI